MGDSIPEDNHNNLLENGNFIHINSNFNLKIKAISNNNKITASDNLYKKYSGINIEKLILRVWDQTVYERLIKKLLKYT